MAITFTFTYTQNTHPNAIENGMKFSLLEKAIIVISKSTKFIPGTCCKLCVYVCECVCIYF